MDETTATFIDQAITEVRDAWEVFVARMEELKLEMHAAGLSTHRLDAYGVGDPDRDFGGGQSIDAWLEEIADQEARAR